MSLESDIKLTRTDTTVDLSQKAEKGIPPHPCSVGYAWLTTTLERYVLISSLLEFMHMHLPEDKSFPSSGKHTCIEGERQ
jgi:hypothetical protein